MPTTRDADLGTNGGSYSEAAGINDVGQVVGFGDNNVYLYTGGQMQNLSPTLSGIPSGINNAGQIVGSANDELTGRYAWVYTGGAMIDLKSVVDPSSGWLFFTEANAINDLGQIVGTGVNSAREQDAFLLTPVPEPATLSLLALGAVGILRRGRK